MNRRMFYRSFKFCNFCIRANVFSYSLDIAASHATTQVNEKNTVLTVPYMITKKQRDVISKCAELAGFHIVQVSVNIYP